jgi:peptide subunit release factor 1 (eRF1)/intein/homing endonuclease
MVDDKKKRELIKLTNRLRNIRGSGTELISLYIPAGYPLTEVTNKLRAEYGQAGNIKSKTTRSNVQDAIDKIINHLKYYRKTPDNGLAIFCGNISKDPGKVNIELFAIEPLYPLNVSIYRCDSEFLLDPLLEQGKVKEKYGLVTIDGKEATIGILEGNTTRILKRLTTVGPSKSTKGGSCIHEDAKVQLENGSVIRIADVREGDKILSYSFSEEKPVFAECKKVMKRTTDYAYRIITKHPRTEIIATKEHKFFIRGTDGVEEKSVDELKIGDTLIHVTNSPIEGKQKELPLKIETKPFLDNDIIEILKQKRNELGLSQEEVAKLTGVTQTVISGLERRESKSSRILPKLFKLYSLDKSLIKAEPLVHVPKFFTPEVCQFLGYTLGDGTIEENRIILYDQDKDLLEHYKLLCEKNFGLEAFMNKPKDNMYELRVYSKWLRNAIAESFPELFMNSEKRDIPDIILTLPADCLSGFIRGLFDAEGTINNRVTIAMRSKHVIEKLRYALLRFGIVSSVYWRKTDEKGIWVLDINDRISIERFTKEIGFSSNKKQNKLREIKKKMNYIRQIPLSGKKTLQMVRQLGLNTRDFANINMFFADRRRMSNETFKKQILNVVKQQEGLISQEQNIVNYLEKVANTEYVSPKIIKIEKIKSDAYFYDLSLPETENFVVNGLVVHNSAARYQRFVEELIEDYYKRVGESMDETLLPAGIKKVIVGGPGPVKENFLKMKPFNYQFQILAVLDTGYVDDYGIQELARKSIDIIAEEKAKKQKKLLEQFFGEVAKNGLAVYGAKETIDAMNEGKVATLLLSEGLEMQHLIVECDDGQEELYVKSEDGEIDEKNLFCSNGKKVRNIISREEVFDEAYEKAEKHGIEVELIPADSFEGKQFLAGFKGIGGILRYK